MLTRKQRDKWAEELESGKYKQGEGSLWLHGKYCCLGVLWYGTNVGPDMLTSDDYVRFVNWNDADKLTFPEIAKHVRALPTSDGEP